MEFGVGGLLRASAGAAKQRSTVDLRKLGDGDTRPPGCIIRWRTLVCALWAELAVEEGASTQSLLCCMQVHWHLHSMLRQAACARTVGEAREANLLVGRVPKLRRCSLVSPLSLVLPLLCFKFYTL